MATKKITVVDARGRESKERLGSRDGYENLLNRWGVAFLVDEEGYNANDFESLVDGGKYTLGPPQHQQPLLLSTEEEGTTLTEMKQFFDGTDVSQFKFQDDASLFMDIESLGWTKTALNITYWRSCYSYILCSIIGAFEVAYDKWIAAKGDPNEMHVNGMTLALTGVQGTGKSVLGSFIALFMAKVFGWRVVYQWGALRHSFGPNTGKKTIAIMDFSTAQAYENTDDFFFILFISSCNSERWRVADQQETWTDEGNLIFIDTVPRREMSAMLEKVQKPGQEDLMENFVVAGGVPQLCSKSSSEARTKIDMALGALDLLQSVKSLSDLKDPMISTKGVGAIKIYPGLLVHAVPTDPFRNKFSLRVSSEYVQKAISIKIKEKQEGDIQRLLKDLIMIPKARGFAGLIWEPLFTRKAKNGKGKLCISGCKLPLSDPSNEKETLFDLPLQNLVTVVFKNMDDFKKKVHLSGLGGNAILAKAVDDNFVAIDGVLIFVSASQHVVVAGLQMTVAQKEHLVKEDGVVHFAGVANWVAEQCQPLPCDKQIWFLQPEECLDDFGFTGLQALAFSAPRNPMAKALAPTRNGRKRARPDKWGEFVTGPQKKQSNNPAYWTDEAKEVTQVVAIARFSEGATGNEEKHATAIAAKLDESEPPEGNAVFEMKPPSRRTWKSTLDAFTKLSTHEGVNPDFIAVLRKDVELDRHGLEQLGAQLDALPSSEEEQGATGVDTSSH